MLAQERRKHIRYKLENAVSINPEGVYQLLDISRGGFCFRCHPHTVLNDFWETDIINSVIPLENFPAKKIWISLHEDWQLKLPIVMLVGVKFNKLESEQKNNLAKLLKKLEPTIGPSHLLSSPGIS